MKDNSMEVKKVKLKNQDNMARIFYIKWGKKQQSRNKRLLIVVGTKNYGKFFLKTLICCI